MITYIPVCLVFCLQEEKRQLVIKALGEKFVDKAGKSFGKDRLNKEFIGLYFSAHWYAYLFLSVFVSVWCLFLSGASAQIVMCTRSLLASASATQSSFALTC